MRPMREVSTYVVFIAFYDSTVVHELSFADDYLSISLSRPQVVRNQIKSFAMNKVTLPPGRYVRDNLVVIVAMQ
jgi:hypothetical protein